MDDRLFGLDPQLIFDTCITLVAMLTLFILLSYLLFDPARKLIEKRKKFVEDQLDKADKAKMDAYELKEQYDAYLVRAEYEVEEMMAEARQKAKDRANEIVGEANGEARRILARAEREVALEKDKVRDEMKQEMVQVASLMAGKFVSRSMDEETQAGLIEETLKEMGEKTWQN